MFKILIETLFSLLCIDAVFKETSKFEFTDLLKIGISTSASLKETVKLLLSLETFKTGCTVKGLFKPNTLNLMNLPNCKLNALTLA